VVQGFPGRLAHAMRRAPIVVQFYLVVVVAVAGTFFCGAAGAGLTAGVAGFGLFATTGAVWALAGVLIGVFIVVGMAVFIAATAGGLLAQWLVGGRGKSTVVTEVDFGSARTTPS
jgi:hypothetical protein